MNYCSIQEAWGELGIKKKKKRSSGAPSTRRRRKYSTGANSRQMAPPLELDNDTDYLDMDNYQASYRSNPNQDQLEHMEGQTYTQDIGSKEPNVNYVLNDRDYYGLPAEEEIYHNNYQSPKQIHEMAPLSSQGPTQQTVPEDSYYPDRGYQNGPSSEARISDEGSNPLDSLVQRLDRLLDSLESRGSPGQQQDIILFILAGIIIIFCIDSIFRFGKEVGSRGG